MTGMIETKIVSRCMFKMVIGMMTSVISNIMAFVWKEHSKRTVSLGKSLILNLIQYRNSWPKSESDKSLLWKQRVSHFLNMVPHFNHLFSHGEHRDYCGYPGISEQECWSQFKCCYYHNRCYYPAGSSAKKNGLTPGGAAGLTFFMFLTFFFIPISFYLYKKNGVNLSMP